MPNPQYDDSSIQQMSQLEHLRSKYQMYIGAGDLDADCQLFKEICDNSCDEALDPEKTYEIKVVFFVGKGRYQVAIVDHGRGVPCGKLKTIYTEAYTSGKYSAKAYNGLSVGTFGIGSKATVSLSKHFVAVSKRLDGFGGLTVSKGVVEKYEVKPALDTDESTVGTSVVYETDQTILKESDKYIESENGLARTINYIECVTAFKRNVKITVYRVNRLLDDSWFVESYEEQWRYLQQVEGTVLYKTPKSANPFDYARATFGVTDKTVWSIKPQKAINPAKDTDTTGFDIEVGLVKNCEKQHGVLATVNFNVINNHTSSHIAVLMDRLKKRIRPFLDEDNHELQVYFDTKYELPLHGYICVLYKNATFIGQTKDGFKDIDFARIYGQALDRIFNTYSHECWENLYDLIVDDLEHKFIAVSNRVFNTGKSLKNAAFKISRIGSYIPCAISSPEVTELLITEGNSAGDFVKQHRNADFQAILKLRGKPLNTIRSDDKLGSNTVCQDLMRLCGVGPNDKDLKNFNFKSIGLLADADPDGYHIVCLLIGCLYKINPLILSSGKVWIANPPLYVHATKNLTLYMRDQKALDDTRAQIYDNYFEIELQNLTNGKTARLHDSSFRDFVYLIKRVGAVINDVATKLAIDPFILEQLTHVVQYLSRAALDCDKIKEMLDLERCEYSPVANVLLMVSDGAEISIPLDNLVHEINAYIMPEVTPIRWGEIQPLVTTKTSDFYKRVPLTFMQIDKIFSEVDKIYNVRRLKGLGECEPQQLIYSCLDPATRTLTTIKEIGDAAKLYQLLGVDPTWRKELARTKINNLVGDMAQ